MYQAGAACYQAAREHLHAARDAYEQGFSASHPKVTWATVGVRAWVRIRVRVRARVRVRVRVRVQVRVRVRVRVRVQVRVGFRVRVRVSPYNPKVAWALEGLAKVHEKCGDLGAALETYRQAPPHVARATATVRVRVKVRPRVRLRGKG